jgi:RNA polymerase sigma factor (sigma-70 family)
MYDDLVAVYKRDMERNKSVGRRLTPEEQAELAREGRYDEIAEAMLPLVLKILGDVLKDLSFQIDQDIRPDLLQAGNIAMMTAIRSWKPDHENGVALTTWIIQAVRRDMFREWHRQRQTVKGVHPEAVYGFSPNFERMYSDDGVEMGLRNQEAYDTGLFGGGTDGEGYVHAEYPDELLTEWEEVSESAERAEWSAKLTDAMEGIPEREQRALHLTVIDGLSTREAAKLLGISHTYVATLRDRALEAVRERI